SETRLLHLFIAASTTAADVTGLEALSHLIREYFNSYPFCVTVQILMGLNVFVELQFYQPTSSPTVHLHSHYLYSFYRTKSVLTRLLLASPNSPLQYPIQGFTVRPLTSTLIPGMVHSLQLYATKTMSVMLLKCFSCDSNNLLFLNALLSKVSYKSTDYHVNTGDLGPPVFMFAFVLVSDISSSVTITTKTFLRYDQLRVLVNSIRTFYANIRIIIADDSFEPQKMTGEHILHYIMPPAQGWFAGRNLAVSQVTTKYFLWVDDDFEFTKDTKIEQLVEVMEAVPELDLGGAVQGNQFYFSIIYEKGDEKEGGCLYRKSRGKYHPLPGYPQCTVVSGVVNFFLARTDAVQRVGFDPKLQRVAHSEFFMDGLGSLTVASCNHVSIGHQSKRDQPGAYSRYRHPPNSDQEFKYQHHFFKNNLKCILFG
uniref:Glycosyltransferase 2-like domain-containing protein n=1 Tax=Sphaeramia orbicularis TaxID=375764 RepID=A0A673A7G1_9TELE